MGSSLFAQENLVGSAVPGCDLIFLWTTLNWLFQEMMYPLLAMPLRTEGAYLTLILRMKTLHEWSDNKEESSFLPHDMLATTNYPVWEV